MRTRCHTLHPPRTESLRAMLLLILWGLGGGLGAHERPADTLAIAPVEVVGVYVPHGPRVGGKGERMDSLTLREQQHLSLAELLHESTPLFVKSYGRGGLATVSFRGTGASHTQIYWNGLRLNSPMSGQVDLSQVPLHAADGVSLHYGQASMMQGAGGLGGAIALWSAPRWGGPTGARVAQTVGCFGTLGTAVVATYGGGRLRMRTRVFGERSDNDFRFRNTARPQAPWERQRDAGYQRLGVVQEAYYRASARSMVAARVWAQQGHRGIPRLMTSFAQHEENRQDDRSVHGLLEWNGYGSRMSWRAATGITHSLTHYRLTKRAMQGQLLPAVSSRSASWSWASRLDAESQLLPWLQAAGGVSLQHHRVESLEAITLSGYRARQGQGGYRLCLTARPLPGLAFSLLVAQELHGRTPSPLLHSLSAEYRLPRGPNLLVRGAWGRNYHYPSLNDRYWQPGGNPSLRAEQGQGWELGFALDAGRNGYRLETGLDIYSTLVDGWIVWLPHLRGYWEPRNIDRVWARGGEWGLTLSYQGRRLSASIMGRYSYTRSTAQRAGGVFRADAQGRQLPFIPIHSGGMVARVGLLGFYATYTFTHFAERFTTTSNNPNSLRTLYPYYMSAVSVGKRAALGSIQATIQLRVDNLLDESYQTILWRPMPGRHYTLTLQAEF